MLMEGKNIAQAQEWWNFMSQTVKFTKNPCTSFYFNDLILVGLFDEFWLMTCEWMQCVSPPDCDIHDQL